MVRNIIASNTIIFGMDGQNWNWSFLGCVYLFSKFPNVYTFSLMILNGTLTMIHYYDNTVFNKWFKNNITYAYELVLVIMFFYLCYLFYTKILLTNDIVGRFLFGIIIFSNMYRIIGSLISRLFIDNNFLDLFFKQIWRFK